MKITPADLQAFIKLNRTRSMQGHVLFNYEGLRNNDDEMAKALIQVSHA